MTATLTRDVSPSTVWTIGTPRLLAGLNVHAVLDHRSHLDVHGPLPGTDLGKLIALLEGVGLTGRGGAGFPLAAKLRALAGAAEVVVNGSESEPASFKDRTLLRRTPHLVLDGALAAANALGARQLTVAVHDPEAAAAVQRARAERPDAARVTVAITSGRFVAGEARALVRGLRGGPALPPGQGGHLTGQGVLVANAETFAQTAVLLRLGTRRFAETGTRDEPGTALITVGGAVARPGVVEIPLGTPLGILLTAAQATDVQAVVAGGYHGSWLAPIPEIHLSRAGLARAGATFGAGVLLAVDHGTCALGELARVTVWLAGESAQQCGPCRFGLPALVADVAALHAGRPANGRQGVSGGAGSAFAHARAVDGRGACKHPDGAARFVTSGLHLLHDETDAHRRGGCGRPVLGRLPITAGGAR